MSLLFHFGGGLILGYVLSCIFKRKQSYDNGFEDGKNITVLRMEKMIEKMMMPDDY